MTCVTSVWRFAAAVFCAALAFSALSVDARAGTPEASGLEVMPAQVAKQKLLAGKELHFVEVGGPIDYLPHTVGKPFVCAPCQFDGPVKAEGVVFKGLVDLRGSQFKGGFDAAGATFSGRALFGPFADTAHRPWSCQGGLYDSKTPCYAFGEFVKAADFSLATFQQAVSFQKVGFDRCRRDAPPACDQADFSLAQFRGEADFGFADFGKRALFGEARFSQPISFIGAHFHDLLELEYGRSGAPVDFDQATFSGLADLRYASVPSLSFAQTIFGSTAELKTEGLATPTLVLAPGSVRHVESSEQERMLSMIESAAKARDDLGVANDADYRLHVLRSDKYGEPWRFLDFAFYRSIAGYLVEPLQPLLTLLALVLLLSILRLVFPKQRRSRLWLRARLFREDRMWRPRRTAAGGSPSDRRRRLRVRTTSPRAGLESLGHELMDSISLVWPGSGAAASGRRLEANLYRLLFVCILIGLANSNPTLRQMLDALH